MLWIFKWEEKEKGWVVMGMLVGKRWAILDRIFFFFFFWVEKIGGGSNYIYIYIYIYMRWVQVTHSVTLIKLHLFLHRRFIRDLTAKKISLNVIGYHFIHN